MSFLWGEQKLRNDKREICSFVKLVFVHFDDDLAKLGRSRRNGSERKVI